MLQGTTPISGHFSTEMQEGNTCKHTTQQLLSGPHLIPYLPLHPCQPTCLKMADNKQQLTS